MGHTEYMRKWRARNPDKVRDTAARQRASEKRRVYNAERHAHGLTRLETTRAGGCSRCGATDRLHFHHRDKATKRHNVATLTMYSDETFEAEVAKCDLLCALCHNGPHAKQQRRAFGRFAVEL